MKKHDFSRRMALRGAGGAAIGLPFLLAREGDTKAQTGAGAPERLITLFFGNGMPLGLTENYDGVLAPLKPHAPKMTMVRGLNVNARSPGNGHVWGCNSFACGMDSTSAASKGGPSLDWVVKEALGANTPLATLSAGIDGGDEPQERVRVVHSWRGPKMPNDPLHEPLALFNYVFGARTPTGSPDPGLTRPPRYRVSVLDAVMSEYRAFVSEGSGYSKGQRTLVADHAETLRELEKRAIQQNMATSSAAPSSAGACVPSAQPPALSRGKNPQDWDKVWPLLVEIYVTALKCDLVRFGNLLMMAGGAPLPFTGVNGSIGSAHSGLFHSYPGGNVKLTLEVFTWGMARVAQVLSMLDDPKYREANGATLLDNTTLMIGTELGEPANHKTTDMTFWIAGAKNRFQRGIQNFAGAGRTDVELYATLLKGMGLPNLKFGDQKQYKSDLPILT